MLWPVLQRSRTKNSRSRQACARATSQCPLQNSLATRARNMQLQAGGSVRQLTSRRLLASACKALTASEALRTASSLQRTRLGC
eukprot:6206889-Pleurochrysis_carterae.AAC.1